MTCESVRFLLPVLGETTEAEQRAVAEHAASCPECNRELAVFEQLRRDLASMGSFEPDGSVYDAIASGVRRRIRHSRQQTWLWAAAAAAAILLAIGLGIRPSQPAQLTLDVAAPGVPQQAFTAGFRTPAPVQVSAPEPPKRQHAAAKSPEPMEIRIVGDDPSVLIVWQIGDLPGGGE